MDDHTERVPSTRRLGFLPVLRSIPFLTAVGIFLLTVCASSYVSLTVFEGIPHLEDEVAFLFQAKTYASGHLFAPTPQNLDFFNLPFLIDFGGHWFGKYPPGHSLILAIGVLIGQPWLINPIASAFTLVLVYLIGRRLYGNGTGLIAAALGLFSPFLLLQSGTLLSHPTTMLLATLFIYAFLRSRDSTEGDWAILAGVCLGWTFLSRQLTGIAIAVPFVVYCLYLVARNPRGELPRALYIVVGIIPFLAGVLAYNTLATGHFLTSPYELYWPFDKVGFGPGVGPGEHTLADAMLNTRVNLEALVPILFGWPLGLSLIPFALSAVAMAIGWGRCVLSSHPFYLAGATSQLKRQVLWDTLLVGTFVCLVLAHGLYWTSGIMYGPRYYFEALPAVLLLSARGIIQVAKMPEFLARLRDRLAGSIPSASIPAPKSPLHRLARIPFAYSAAAIVVGLLVAWNLVTYLPAQFEANKGWYGITGEDHRLARSLNLGRAVVLVPPGKDWTSHVSLLILNDPFLQSDTIYALDRGPQEDQTLLRQFPDRTLIRWTDIKAGLAP